MASAAKHRRPPLSFTLEPPSLNEPRQISASLALAHDHHEKTREIAETAVGLFDEYVRAPLRASDLPDDEKAERLVEAFRTLLPTVTALVAHHFRSVLLEVAQEHLEAVGDATELAAARNEPGWEAT